MKRLFLSLCLILSLCLLPSAFAGHHKKDEVKKPNILWISCEDISPRLGCYGDQLATTPNLDKFASQGVRFEQAHHIHGVCAPARTGIITAMWPTAMGNSHMRSSSILPTGVKPFPIYLKEAGYYCTNKTKTDYNFYYGSAGWDGRGTWRNRPDKNMPFFSVINITTCHESGVWPVKHGKSTSNFDKSEFHDPEKMIMPPYYPETAAAKASMARLYDVITAMDKQVGQILKDLEDDGLAEDTIVLFWSDHGDGLPRAKRWIYDSGTRVPLMARIPAKYRNLVTGGNDVHVEAGSVDTRLVSMIDLGPTMLTLAGIKVPSHMNGKPFWGKDAHEGHKYVFAGRDRVDERYDMVRMVRSRTHRYVRNYMPWYTWLRKIDYAENNAIRKEMRRLLAEGSLHQEAAQWLGTPRPFEELYDLTKDPHEVKNVANDPAYANQLNELRSAMDNWVLKNGDCHLLAEPFQLEYEIKTKKSRRIRFEESDVATLLKAAQDAANPKGKLETLKQTAGNGDPAVRWWAYMGMGYLSMTSMTNSSDAVKAALEAGLKDEHAAVQTAACWGLVQAGVINETIEKILLDAYATNNPGTRLWAATVIEQITLDKPERKGDLGAAVAATSKSNITIKGRDAKYFERVAGNFAPAKPKKKSGGKKKKK